MINNRLIIKIAGESGQGINAIGEILTKAIKNSGYYVFGYREYPSLIKGGWASYQLDMADFPLNSSSKYCHLLACVSRRSVREYLRDLRPQGILLHSIDKLDFSPADQEFIDTNHITVHYIDAINIATAHGGNKLMTNVVMTGFIWKAMQLNIAQLKAIIALQFADKPKLLELDLKCLEAGYDLDFPYAEKLRLPGNQDSEQHNSMIISGNDALAIGAVSAGVRAYYGYPMTPTSSLQSYLSENYHETGMLIKQAEDEITAVQMTLGSMFMGTRALTATSGGGFDLMTETISLSAMTETPLVCIIGQRPGPATGMPSWTTTSDLNLAIYAGHGEFVRCVLAVSDVISAYELIQQAYNIAEKFQIPVILLTEKQIAEGLFNIAKLPAPLPIERHLVKEPQLDKLVPTDRYRITESGISPRWLPGQSPTTFLGNSDEHLEDGTMTEDADPAEAMFTKRMRKEESLLADLPEPILYGEANASITLVGWGSVKNTVLDVMRTMPQHVNYLHYEYMYPLKTDKLQQLISHKRNLVLIENNYLGQLGNLIRQHIGYEFKHKILKFNGRPFFCEDVIDYLHRLI